MIDKALIPVNLLPLVLEAEDRSEEKWHEITPNWALTLAYISVLLLQLGEKRRFALVERIQSGLRPPELNDVGEEEGGIMLLVLYYLSDDALKRIVSTLDPTIVEEAKYIDTHLLQRLQ